MGNKENVDLAERNIDLPQTYGNAASCVEQQLLIAGLDERARTESVCSRRRRTGAEQRDFEITLGMAH